MRQMRDGTSLQGFRLQITTEGNLPGLHQTYLHVRSELPGALLVVKLGPVNLLLVKLGPDQEPDMF
uniref:Uncharacterized protein n=1 Tax=Leersia perrieri TaxID=77586 RepID=A0A0D9W4W2_9ORYZ